LNTVSNPETTLQELRILSGKTTGAIKIVCIIRQLRQISCIALGGVFDVTKFQ